MIELGQGAISIRHQALLTQCDLDCSNRASYYWRRFCAVWQCWGRSLRYQALLAQHGLDCGSRTNISDLEWANTERIDRYGPSRVFDVPVSSVALPWHLVLGAKCRRRPGTSCSLANHNAGRTFRWFFSSKEMIFSSGIDRGASIFHQGQVIRRIETQRTCILGWVCRQVSCAKG